MTAITRVDDLGQGHCTCHDEDVIVTFRYGAASVKLENKQGGNVTVLLGEASCGHLTIARLGSSTTFFENQAVHRINDLGEIGPGCGTYTVATGSPTVFADEGGPSMPAVEPFSVGLGSPPNLAETIVPAGSVNNPNRPPRDRQPSECTEGYVNSLPEPDGQQGSGTGEPLKIANSSIPVDCSLGIHTTLKLEGDASQVTNLNWALDPLPPGISLNPVSGAISGMITAEGTYGFDVEAKDGTTVLDKKHFKIEAKACTGQEINIINPLPGSIRTSPFGIRTRAGVTRMHKGIDLAYSGGKIGNVVAAASGVCSYTGVNSGYGNVVILSHLDGAGNHGFATLYAHLDKIVAVVGLSYNQGQVIGIEGNTGVGSGPHLHFEIRKPDLCTKPGIRPNFGAEARDPWPYVQGMTKISVQSVIPGETADSIEGSTGPSVPVRTSDMAETCSGYVPPAAADIGSGNPLPSDTSGLAKSNGDRANCAPGPATQTKQQVIDQITTVLNQDPELTQSDKNFILYVARVESNFDPYAVTPPSLNTSATGLFQMVDGTAATYGLTSCADRCDIIKSTEAMIKFHKNYIKHNYNQLINSGFTRCNDGTVPANAAAKYSTLPPEAIMYMIHHDGAANVRKGKDVGGLEYFNKTFGK